MQLWSKAKVMIHSWKLLSLFIQVHDIMNNSYFYQDLTKDLLPLVLDPIVTALKDDDDDVRAVAASALLPVAESLVKFAPSYVSTVWYVGSVIYFMQFTCSFDDMM